mmetsp:Transcript_33097/g.87882  ORF Transcript_33097/g.87882 Transcript_33097/m.87882 type:complete len:349 (-) Transcript_33097:318-1364(-)
MPRLRLVLNENRHLNKKVAEQLGKIGINTVEELLSCDPAHLCNNELTQDQLFKFVNQVAKACAPMRRTGRQIFDDLTRKSSYLPTGCRGFDEALLQGGFMTGEITELSGPSGSGKTQICLAAAANVARDCEGTVAFFDSGSSFSAQRIEEICMHQDAKNSERSLLRIRHFLVTNVTSLLSELAILESALEIAAGYTQEDSSLPLEYIRFVGRLKLLVIDSLGAIFSPVLGWESHQQNAKGHERGMSHNQPKDGPTRPLAGGLGYAQLESTVCALQRIMSRHHVAIVVTNTNTAIQDSLWSDYKARALGWQWPGAPSVSICLIQDSEQARIGRVRKSFRVSYALSIFSS